MPIGTIGLLIARDEKFGKGLFDPLAKLWLFANGKEAKIYRIAEKLKYIQTGDSGRYFWKEEQIIRMICSKSQYCRH